MDQAITPPYPQFVARLIKHPSDIISDLTGSVVNLLHMGVGVATEMSELQRALYRCEVLGFKADDTFQDRDCTQTILEAIAEEVGDCLFYLQGIANQINITSPLDCGIPVERPAIRPVLPESPLETIKRVAMYGKPLDPVLDQLAESVVKHAEWLEHIGFEYGFTLEYAMLMNVKKLSKRYASLTFSNEEAEKRADKTLTPA